MEKIARKAGVCKSQNLQLLWQWWSLYYFGVLRIRSFSSSSSPVKVALNVCCCSAVSSIFEDGLAFSCQGHTVYNKFFHSANKKIWWDNNEYELLFLCQTIQLIGCLPQLGGTTHLDSIQFKKISVQSWPNLVRLKYSWVLQSDQVWSRLDWKQKFFITMQNFGRTPS